VKQTDWQQIEQILASVLELPEDQRSSRVDQLSSGNANLRSELVSLLAAHDRAGSFLEVETRVSSDSARSLSLASKQLGPYRLLEAIGHGGMGTVYRAERADGQFQKQVAVKVVPAAAHSPELLRRFTSEQQILATLEHPNIARLLDAGVSSDGVPYLVMEYVEGVRITDYCRERKLSIRERLRLFRTVCSTVHYAHQHLVVHRDIKPANILVTNEGIPKLLDFGIAKLLDPWMNPGEGSTQSIFNPMTPDYASPEQVRGEALTTATDVYSLGMVLYELLTEERPYAISGKPLAEALRVICETQIEKPSAVLRRTGDREHASRTSVDFSYDIDAIVSKAVRKDAKDRYTSAREFHDDLGRYLSGLPVAAREGSFRYIATKFLLRHRLAVLGTVSLLLIATGGGAVVLWEAHVAHRERAKAEARFNQVRSLANSLMFDVHDSIKDLPGAVPARKLIAKRALEYLDALAREAAGDGSLQRELAASYERVGDVQDDPTMANLGDATGAIASYGKALAIRKALLDTHPGDAKLRLDLSGSYWKLGNILKANGSLTESLTSLRSALVLAEQSGIADGERLAGDHWAIANVLVMTRDLPGALENYRAAASIREALAQGSHDISFRMHQAGDYYGMAEVLQRLGQFGQADEAARKAIAILEELSARNPNNATLRQYLASAYMTLGASLAARRRLNEALDSYTKAQRIYRAATKADLADTQSRGLLIFANDYMADALVNGRRPAEALHVLKENLAILDELAAKAPEANYLDYYFGNTCSTIAMAHATLASDHRLPVASRRSEWREARRWYQKSLDVWLRMKRQGKLAGDEIGEPERIPKEIAKCDGALALLGQ
jgi:non-specific serine/threonine protein kinase/serine/threonine-protein kinase